MDLGGGFGTESVLCDILKRLPVQSLLRFMSVSKPWSHLINDPFFLTSHLQFNKSSSSSSSSLLGITFSTEYRRDQHSRDLQFEYFRIDHSEETKTTLEHLKIPFLWRLKPDPKPEPRTHGPRISIRGHCNGLILAFESQTFYVDECTPEFPDPNRTHRPRCEPFDVDRYIICNPIARRFLILPESTIEPPNFSFEVEVYGQRYEYKKLSAVGLGFIDDVVYKVVRVTYGMAQIASILGHIESFKPYVPPWVEVYDSRSSYWRRVPMNSEFSYEYLDDGVFNSFDGCLYWLGRGCGNRDKYSTLVWFHLVDETWHETLLPYKSRHDIVDEGHPGDGVFGEFGVCESVQMLGESVVLFVVDQRNWLVCSAWKMNKGGDDKVSWTHMYRVNFGGSPLGFLGNGELLLMRNSRRMDDSRRVFLRDGSLWRCEWGKEEDWGKVIAYDSKKVNKACFGFTDLGLKVGNVVPKFVESLVLLDGESGFVEDVSEKTYYFPEEPVKPRKKYVWEEEDDLIDLPCMFDDNLELTFI